jgi:putative tryptophan/tyrosine transport system substrate-binding protein
MLATLALLVPGLTAPKAEASDLKLRVVTGGKDEATLQILEVLRRHFPAYTLTGGLAASELKRAGGVYLSIGPAALQAAFDAGFEPVLSVFASNEAYTRLAAVSPGRRRGASTAIYAEVGPVQAMELIRRIYSRSVVVGVMLTAQTAHLLAPLQSAAAAASVDVEVEILEPGATLPKALTRLRSANVVLAIPDPSLYSPSNFRDVLEATYRRNQGLIGFTPAMVAAGALACVYASIDDTLAQAVPLARAIGEGKMSTPQYPSYWRVSVNDNVARSLNLVVDGETRALRSAPP